MAAVVLVPLRRPSCSAGGWRPRGFTQGGVRIPGVAQRRHPLCLPPCRQEDSTVREANSDGWQEEGQHACPQGKGEGDP